MILKGTTFCYCNATLANLRNLWIVERELKYQITKYHQGEGQYCGRQNSQNLPPPKPMVRFREAEHVYGRIILIEVIGMIMVTSSVCHDQNRSITAFSRFCM